MSTVFDRSRFSVSNTFHHENFRFDSGELEYFWGSLAETGTTPMVPNHANPS